MDAAMDGNVVAAQQILITNKNREEISGGVQSKKWDEGMLLAGEGLGVLDLVKSAQNILRTQKEVR